MRSSRREIAFFLAGPTIWAAHFFALYGMESFTAGGSAPQLVATAVALAACALVVRAQFKVLNSALGDRDFLRRAGVALAGLSALGIVWTTLPVLLAP